MRSSCDATALLREAARHAPPDMQIGSLQLEGRQDLPRMSIAAAW